MSAYCAMCLDIIVTSWYRGWGFQLTNCFKTWLRLSALLFVHKEESFSSMISWTAFSHRSVVMRDLALCRSLEYPCHSFSVNTWGFQCAIIALYFKDIVWRWLRDQWKEICLLVWGFMWTVSYIPKEQCFQWMVSLDKIHCNRRSTRTIGWPSSAIITAWNFAFIISLFFIIIISYNKKYFL